MGIKKHLSLLRSIWNKAVKGGFFHILSGNTLAKIISAIPGLLMVIVLSKTHYADLGYADNIVSYFFILDGFGLSGAILRYVSIAETDGKRTGYLKFGAVTGLLLDFAVIVPAFVVFYFFPFQYRIYNVLICALLFTPLLSYAFECVQYFFRATRENKRFSRLSVVYAAAMAALPLPLAYYFKLGGVVAGRYLAYGITLFTAIALLKKLPVMRTAPDKLGKREKKEFLHYAFWSMLASGLSLILPANEQNFVNNIIRSNAVTGEYRFASILPQAVTFVAIAVVVFVFPYFAKHYKDGKWIWRNTVRLTVMLTAATGIFTILAIIFTPQIIAVYKKDYLNAETVHIMRLLWVTFGINSCLRVPMGNILAAVGEVRFNMANAGGAAAVHAVVGYIMVRSFGIYGAAYGLCIVYTLSAVSGFIYMRHYCKNLDKAKKA